MLLYREPARGSRRPGRERRLRRFRWRGAWLLPVLSLATGLPGCNRSAAHESASVLQAATVERRSIVSSVEATGTIEPIRVIDIKSQASGEILELPVELGDHVERGQLLVRIDPRDVRNAYQQAVADLDVARARFEVAERQLERTRALRDSAVVTQDELESALLEHANARASLVKGETNLELARDRTNDVTLRAPIAGTIVERHVEEGQIITGAREVTGGTILMRMADLTEVQVRTLVDETDIGRVEAGLPATIRVEAYRDRDFQGTVLKIEPQAVVEQNVTMFAVLTRIRNEGGLLKPGMNADVEIVLGREESALTLPNAAVKTASEARQLAQVLGVATEPLSARPAGGAALAAEGDGGGEGGSRAGGRGEAVGSGTPAPDARGARSPPSAERLRSMSQDERRRALESLPPADRQRLLGELRAQRQEEQRANRVNSGGPRPAFVFVEDRATGRIRLEPITIGLSNFEYTQVLEGLKEGDRVLEIPLSLLQQRELLERVRSRTGVPGVQRN